MLKETAANQAAWDKLAQDHYNHFRKSLKDDAFKRNPVVVDGLGSIKGKRILHSSAIPEQTAFYWPEWVPMSLEWISLQRVFSMPGLWLRSLCGQ